MTDTARLKAALANADQALAEVVAVFHDRELRCFHAPGHDAEAIAWAGDVDELQNLRDVLRRMPFAAHFESGSGR